MTDPTSSTRPNFSSRVYAAISQIPSGKISTYKEVAHYLGSKSYRAVGQALKRNPFAPQVPCHRVIGSDGKIGGFMGKKTGDSIVKKMLLLAKEGIVFEKNKIVNLEQKLHRF